MTRTNKQSDKVDNHNLGGCPDVPESEEEAGSQADLPDEAEQLRDPQTDVRHSTATGDNLNPELC